MYRAERWISRIQFGNNEDTLFVRVDLHRHQPATLVLHIQQPAEFRIELAPLTRERRVAVFAVPLVEFGASCEAAVAFQVKAVQDGIERESYPESVPIQFTLVGDDFLLRNWIV